jgi:hypothetical protein
VPPRHVGHEDDRLADDDAPDVAAQVDPFECKCNFETRISPARFKGWNRALSSAVGQLRCGVRGTTEKTTLLSDIAWKQNELCIRLVTSPHHVVGDAGVEVRGRGVASQPPFERRAAPPHCSAAGCI